VILTVKVLPEVDRAALIRPAVGPRTVIVLIENGVDIEPDIAAAFPDNELLSGLAFVAIVHSAQGEIRHQSAGPLTLGRYPRGVTPAAQRIATMLEASGIRCTLAEDLVAARWQKAVWNTVFNPISILGGVLDTAMMLRTTEDREFIRRTMQEVCDIAAADGRPMNPKLIERYIADTHAIPAYKTSMAQDHENGRPLEIEAIIGNAVRAGRRLGVAMPSLEAVYALARMVAGSQSLFR
jgi:2-dehydropantoate 2-reductase